MIVYKIWFFMMVGLGWISFLGFLGVVGGYFICVISEFLYFGAEYGLPLFILYFYVLFWVVFQALLAHQIAEIEYTGNPLLHPREGQVVVCIDDGLSSYLRHYVYSIYTSELMDEN